ncbi:S-adenosyl-L-methionine-dependent methyltransferase, partial [Gongronella butleri]
GCGPGTVALELAKHFDKVVGIDPSASMLETAKANAASAGAPSNVTFQQASAENLPLPDGSVDVITVAQSLHWFDPILFLKEARRVLKPKGTLIAWGYMYARIIDHPDLLEQLGTGPVLGPYWEPNRAVAVSGCISWFPQFQAHFPHVQHRSFPMPLTRVSTVQQPPWMDDLHLTLDQLISYVKTWSSYKNYKDDPANAQQPDIVEMTLRAALPTESPDQIFQVQWPHSIFIATLD